MKTRVYSPLVCIGSVLPLLALATCGTLVEEGGGLNHWGLEQYAKYEHGWPFIFARRVDDVGPSFSGRFDLFSGESDFQWFVLFADVLVVLAMALTMSCVFAYLARTGLRFSLRTVFVCLTLAAIPLAHLAWMISMCREDVAVYLRLEDSGCSVNGEYVGPRWLARASGTLAPFGIEIFGITRISVHSRSIDVDRFVNDVSHLKFLRRIVLWDGSVIEADSNLNDRLLWALKAQEQQNSE